MVRKPSYDELTHRIRTLEKENFELKRLGDSLENRISALTRSFEDDEGIAFEDLFDLEDIQCIQDEFASATGVASIITRTDGTPITAPSNFCRLCKDMLRKTETGLANCFRSDTLIGRFHSGGAIVEPCMSGGFWDAGSGITVGGKHVANWVIGQVRDDRVDEAQVLRYARDMKADEKCVLEAFYQVPAMSFEQFEQISKVLFILAKQLSKAAYQKIQQTRFILERSQTEKMIKESEERFRYLSDGSMEAIFFTQKGFCLEANQVAAEIFGYDDRSEFIGMFGTDIIAPECHDIVKRHMLNDSLEPYEAIGVRKNGTRFPISIRAKAMPYKDKGIVRVTSISDITRIKETENALRMSEKKYHFLFRNAQVALFRTSIDGKLIEINKRYAEIAGYATIEDCMDSFSPGRAWADSNARGELLRIIQAKGSVNDYEAEIIRRDGAHIWILFSATVYPEQGFIEGSLVEITDRKKMEETLRQSETYLRTLIHTIPDLVWLKDKDGLYLFCNSRFERFFGAKEERIIGKTDYDFVDRAQADFFREHDKLAMAKGGPSVNEEAVIYADDGHHEILETIKTPLYDGDGRLIGVLGIARDITERKQAEEERKKLEGQLRQSHKMEAIGTIAGGIAHDFNNILGIIIGNVELAMDDIEEWHPAVLNLKEIKQASLRASDVVRQLLNFSRKTEQSKKTIDIQPMIKESIKLLRSSIPKSIEIQMNLPDRVKTILADQTQIHQVLINLCANAAHAMEKDGGILKIDLSEVELDTVAVTQFQEIQAGHYVQLTISDTGHGIDPATKAKIFDPYFTTKSVGKGTGMGLAVVLGIVQNHSGAISVYSEPGVGSTFKILFPVVDGDVINGESVLTELPKGNERILFVDDEAGLVEIGRTLLKRLGYQVETKTDPTDVLELIRSDPYRFDLIVTDMTMPHISGDHLLKEILDINPGMPVILCTGFSNKIDSASAVRIGAKGYIEKPLDKRQLAYAVRKALDNR